MLNHSVITKLSCRIAFFMELLFHSKFTVNEPEFVDHHQPLKVSKLNCLQSYVL